MISFFLFILINSKALAIDSMAQEKMVFENRAACAADSKIPAHSAFLIVDSYNAGKMLDSILKGRSNSESTLKTVDQGLKILRLSLTEIWMTLTNEILEGRLPLLNVNEVESANQEQEIKKIFQNWTDLNEGDTFTRHPEIKRGISEPTSTCIYIKHFSELQSNLNHDRPDQALLQKIALASQSKNDLITDCFDDSDTISSRRFLLQIDVNDTTRRHWKKYGFNFWYSLKTYFSYAWRNPELILKSNHPLTEVFKNLAIEQMIMLVPNGCESIEVPECSLSQVSLDLFRILGNSSITELDHPFSLSPPQTILNNPIAVNREDSATIPENKSTEEWLQEFQSRILKKRGLLKQKFLLAISQFEFLFSLLSRERISAELINLKKEILTNPLVYRKMQVLCSEFDIATRPEVNLLEEKIKNSLKISKFKNLLIETSDLQLQEILDFYLSISNVVFPICEEIRIEKIWKSETTVASTSYSDWYRDLTGKWKIPAPSPSSNNSSIDLLGMGDCFNQKATTIAPLLTREKITASGKKETVTICEDASDCARIILKSMIDLHIVSSWIDIAIPANEIIQSPHLMNPWATTAACKIYDPWFATKQSMIGFLGDLISTTATGILPVPAYFSVQPHHREVKDFNLLPYGDDIYLTPIRSGKSVDITLGVDMGPWSGIPCAAVFSPTSNIPIIGGYYSIAGIRFEACTGTNNHRLILSSGSPTGVNLKNTFSGCAICYLTPYSTSKSLLSISGYSSPPLKVAIGAIFSGISFAKKLTNKIDIPKRFEVAPELVEETYQRYSFIPKRCVRRLSKGRSCRHVFLTKEERENLDP